jgi:hypothetical protein
MHLGRASDALLAFVTVAALAAAPAPAAEEGDWRGARWGMTEAEVLKAFPGEAVRLEKPEKLADGNVVSLGIEKHAIGSTTFRVRFVFDPAGKLVLVSLRTDPLTYAEPKVFDATRKALSASLGEPAASSSDDNYIDMRQSTWWTRRSRIDVKFIPGVVAVVYAPTDGGPPPPPVPPLLAKPPGTTK